MILSLLLSLLALVPVEKHAVVESCVVDFTMNSPTSGRCNSSSRITVLDEKGLQAAYLFVVEDEFRKLGSFSGNIYYEGEKPQRIKSKDLHRELLSTDQVDASVLIEFIPSVKKYPFTVEYEYVVNYSKGVPLFPVFMPLKTFGTELGTARYSITVPQGCRLRWLSDSEPENQCSADSQSYVWTYSNVAAKVKEDNMPDLSTLVPLVRAFPEQFSYLGTTGSQKDWKSLGMWHSSLLPSGELPDSFVGELKSATVGMGDIEKLRYVYSFLGEHTRYVSVQLGIGGFAPELPATVLKHGYGDCKGLTCLAAAMLEAVGVKSVYSVVSTGNATFPEKWSALGMMDHVMLCVPLEKDSVWVECTNVKFPLGYRHSSADGHQFLLVEGDDSRLVRAPSYPDSLVTDRMESRIRVFGDGSAQLDCSRSLRCGSAEPYMDIRNWDRDRQMRSLLRSIRANMSDFAIVSVDDNFNGYAGNRDYIPELTLNFRTASNTFAKKTGDRLFVPMPAFASIIPTQRGERFNDLLIRNKGISEEIYVLELPDGFELESLPDTVSMDNDFFSCRLSCTLEGRAVRTCLRIRIKPGRHPREAYREFRRQAQEFNRLSESMLVLRSAQSSTF